MRKSTPPLLFLLALLAAPLSSAAAMDKDIVYDSKGNPFFELNYYYTNEYSESDNLHSSQTPAWNVTDPAIRQSIHNAGKAWADILGSFKLPASIAVVGESRDNDSASSVGVAGHSDYTSVGAALIQGYDGRIPNSANLRERDNGIVFVGNWPSFGGTSFYSDAPITALPHNGDLFPVEVVFFHEFGHALGISGNVGSANVTAPNGQTIRIHGFLEEINLFAQGLVNAQGRKATPNTYVAQNAAEAKTFVDAGLVSSIDEVFIGDEVFFQGKHLSEVLQGAYGNRAPINGWERGDPEFSHLEFKNSLMSHQSYRNTGVFFEAELAIMQDIGYDIDRRNFYGLSIYNDGQTIVNNQGFFARNDDGTAYLDGIHNQASNAVGLHIFGNDNNVTQNADILAAGFGSLGARIDGQGNHLTINKDVRIESRGDLGIGVAVAYGRGHTLNHKGVILADGADGRGVSFDFGSNIMSDVLIYEGSYISTNKLDASGWGLGTAWQNDDLENMVNGALANRFDVSGAIVSDNQAIFISEDAHVREINILGGAYLQGDIISQWNPNTIAGDKHSLQLQNLAGSNHEYKDFVTSLTFGRAQDADGNVAAGADGNFRMRYSDDIKGPGGLAMHVAGGALEYNGDAHVVRLVNESPATLAGTGTLRIADPTANVSAAFNFAGRDTYENNFRNDGRIAPGDAGNTTTGAMRIELDRNADFINNGTIQIGFAQDGDHDVLTISGNASNAVLLNGVTELHAIAGYYANGVRQDFTIGDMIQIGNGVAVTGGNTIDVSSFSPTVDFKYDRNGQTISVYATRNENSYAQFGNDEATVTVGRELSRISNLNNMPASFHQILAGLDLAGSAKGVEYGLNQLVPHFANAAAQQSLDNQRVMSNALFSRLLPEVNIAAPSCPSSTDALSCGDVDNNDGMRVFATAIGGGGKQDGKGYALPGYSFWSTGVMTGVEVSRGGVTGGMHIAMNHWNQRGDGGSGHKNRVNAFSFGLHASVAPSDWNGGYLFALARGTVERNRMERAIALSTGGSVNSSKWTGWSGNAVLGGGFDFECGSFRIGPMAGLDYALNHRGSIREDGRFGRLDIDSGTYQSFRVLAGLRASGKVGERTTLSGTARWNYEMLDKTGTTRAKFADVGLNSFSTRGRYAGRHSLTASIGLKHALTDRAYLEVEGGGEFFRGGHASGWGSASIAWDF